MLDQGELARGAAITVCGREFWLDRSLEMLRRAEAAVGAVAPFAQRLDARAARSDEIARVYGALLRDVHGAPTGEEIAEWVFASGMRHQVLALYLFSLTMGSSELEKVSKERGLNAERSRDEARGPFAPTAPPTGRSSTTSDSYSDGRPFRPAPTRFTS
jgi:hypothetical protein